jgi:hypothetical protein
MSAVGQTSPAIEARDLQASLNLSIRHSGRLAAHKGALFLPICAKLLAESIRAGRLCGELGAFRPDRPLGAGGV